MDEKRKIYENFMSIHAHKAVVTDTPTEHVMFYEEGKAMFNDTPPPGVKNQVIT
jgi:hypothetical protein